MRSFTATGEPNKLAFDKRDRVLHIDETGSLAEKDKDPWDPRNMLAVLDGLEAIKWAWIFVEIGAETHVIEYIDWFIKHVRIRPQRLDTVKRLWDASGWRLALDLRSNRTFREATTDIMQDTSFLADNMHSVSPPFVARPLKVLANSPQKSAQRFAGPYTSTPICLNFQKGTCRMGDKCRYRHINNSQAPKKGKGKGRQPKGAGKGKGTAE